MKKKIGVWFLSFCFLALHAQEEVLNNLASLIQLSTERTEINLNDYFIEGDKVKIVRVPKGLTTQSFEKGILTVEGGMAQTLDCLSVRYQQKVYDIPIRNSAKIPYEFTFVPDRAYVNLQIKGSFNGWNTESTTMILKDGKYQFTAMLNPGMYQYCLVEGDKEFIDPTNSRRVSNGVGGYNSTFSVGDLASEKPFITTRIDKNNRQWKIASDQMLTYLVFVDNQLILKEKSKKIESQGIKIPKHAQRSYLRVYAYNQAGEVANDILLPLKNGQPITDPSALGRIDQRSYIMYSLMVDRFNDGNPKNNYKVGEPEVRFPADYHGGDLAGIIQKIDEGFFNELGINTIWLTPIVQNPYGGYGQKIIPEINLKTKFAGYHGYWPISSSKIDTRLGTEEEFRMLIQKAHQKNLNIVVDYVANHVHLEHPILKQHPDWITSATLPDGSPNIKKFDSERFTTWFDSHIPSLDFSNHQVVEAMIDSAIYWLKNYDIDGFRHDATKHIQDDFWRTLTRKIRQQIAIPQNRSIYQIGETYGSHEMINAYINNGMLDAQFDFNLYHHLSHSITNADISMKDLKVALEESMYYYGAHHVMGNISGNHDKIRITSMADGSFAEQDDTEIIAWTKHTLNKDIKGFKRTALVMACNMSLPGVPVIYYGDELGMPGASDPDNRRMMIFDMDQQQDTSVWVHQAQKELRKTTQRLIQLRKENMALLYGDMQMLTVSDRTLAYMRNYMDNTVITFINSSDKAEKITVEVYDKSYQSMNDSPVVTTKKKKASKKQITLEVKPYSFEILYHQ